MAPIFSPRVAPVNPNDPRRWVLMQLTTFTNWVNEQLSRRDMRIENLGKDFADGVNLIALVEVLQNRRCPGKIYFNSQLEVQHLANIQLALDAMADDGVKLVNIGNHDVAEGNLKLILGLIWCLVLRYQIGDRTKVPAKKLMLAWLQAVLPELSIRNFCTDWNNGIALAALLEYCQPGIFPDWKSLDPKNSEQNCRTAMELARDAFGIPVLLAPEDFASSSLDELSAMTYLSYFMTLNSPGYLATLDRVQNCLPEIAVRNFTLDWNNGLLLCQLLHNLGLNAPEMNQLNVDHHHWAHNIQIALDEAQRLRVEPIFSAHEIADPHVDHLGVMAYVATLMNLVSRKREKIEVVLQRKSWTTHQQASFDVRFLDPNVTVNDIDIEIADPNGLATLYNLRRAPQGASVTFVPVEAGPHQVSQKQ